MVAVIPRNKYQGKTWVLYDPVADSICIVKQDGFHATIYLSERKRSQMFMVDNYIDRIQKKFPEVIVLGEL